MESEFLAKLENMFSVISSKLTISQTKLSTLSYHYQTFD